MEYFLHVEASKDFVSRIVVVICAKRAQYVHCTYMLSCTKCC